MQKLSDGQTSVVDVPAPAVRSGSVCIRTSRSLISAGTERMLVEFGQAGWLGKARQQPEKVRAVIAKVRSSGLQETLAALRAKLAMPIPLGYCQVGTVISSALPGAQEGAGETFRAGDRVVSNGSHAEVVSVSPALCARIPDAVTDEAATFTPLAAIAWEGIVLLAVQPGERVVVVGLGLIGQLAVRILRGLGCEVLGVDPAPERAVMAARYGAQVPAAGVGALDAALAWSKGQGVAGVLITASAPGNEIISAAARSCRYRGRVVLVGVVGLQLNRADFYRNEVSFQVSCSYGRRDHVGPGSAQANFRQVLTWMAEGKLPVGDLISHRFPLAEAAAAYTALRNKAALGIVLEYGGEEAGPARPELLATEIVLRSESSGSGGVGAGILGAGNFAIRTLLPALQSQRGEVRVEGVVSTQGLAAWYAAKTAGAAWAGTDEARLWRDERIRAVFVTTRHDAHVDQALAALRARKHVWVEKPLALTLPDLDRIRAVFSPAGAGGEAGSPILMVGFNRRFAPMATALRQALANRKGPLQLRMVINAGRLDPEHWALDPKRGGGRLVGEACHFVDLARYWCGGPIAAVVCERRDTDGQDGGCFTLRFADGSEAKIDYRTDLPAAIPKERIEVSGPGFRASIENWARLRSEGLGGLRQGGFWRRAPRKGHPEAVSAFLAAVNGAPWPIPQEELLEVSAWAIRLQGMGEGEEVGG